MNRTRTRRFVAVDGQRRARPVLDGDGDGRGDVMGFECHTEAEARAWALAWNVEHGTRAPGDILAHRVREDGPTYGRRAFLWPPDMVETYNRKGIGGRLAGAAAPYSVEAILAAPDASFWLKAAVRGLLARDPCDAATDAEVLAEIMRRRADAILAGGEVG
jgi:hypothetical protein